MKLKKWIVTSFFSILFAFLILSYFLETKYWILSTEYCLFCVSWALLALRTWRDKISGFPAWVISIVFSWELFAVFYGFPPGIPIPSLFRLYFIVWCLLSFVNLSGAFRFSSGWSAFSLSPRSFRVLLIMAVLSQLLFYFYYVQLPDGSLKFYDVCGAGTVPMISFGFLLALIFRKNFVGFSLSGNLIRIVAQNGRFIDSMINSRAIAYPNWAQLPTIFFDVIFLTVLVYKSWKWKESLFSQL